jgi:hypothetical protein
MAERGETIDADDFNEEWFAKASSADAKEAAEAAEAGEPAPTPEPEPARRGR